MTNKELARLTIRESNNLMEWMEAHGCRFQPSILGTPLIYREPMPFFSAEEKH
jgi:hypothetical protein